MDQNSGVTAKSTSVRTLSLWLAIGVLVAAAVLGSVFIIVGDQAAVAGRAWLTLLLAAAFAGVVVLDSAVADGPNRWYLPVSIGINALLFVIGILKIWGGFYQPEDTGDAGVWIGQLFLFLWIVILLRVALLVTQTYGLRFVRRATKQLSRVFATLALVFVWLTAVLLALPAALPSVDWSDVWWRYVGASALVTVVLFLIPVVLLAFEPRQPRAQQPVPPYGYAPYPQQQQYPGAAQYPGQQYPGPQYPGAPQYGAPGQYPAAPQFGAPGQYPPAPQYGDPQQYPVPQQQQPVPPPQQQPVPQQPLVPPVPPQPPVPPGPPQGEWAPPASEPGQQPDD
ncbi:hypothetical protein [Leifsonia sp. SIMBA_070]|uniref:hypothetical protein n=1 Tax=Leifsonia sp. SIMBA_070 TaxID=3085810 RepID=UPI00397999EE